METNHLKNYKIRIGAPEKTVFDTEKGIYQDGTTPVFRDKDGKLWAMSGHTHVGHIGVFCGSKMSDLKELYPIKTSFSTGKAGEAFNCVRYPEGVLPRGSIWPMGLYICPVTHRFFCFFHNETGWAAKGTGYVIKGKGDGEPDFRHIGLMHSDDEGRTWNFDRWVITSRAVCFSEYYNPDGVNVVGQKKGITCLGAGDFSLFVDRKNKYLYILYNLLDYDSEKDEWISCDLYVARAEMLDNGLIGDFVKYYNGSFSTAGNLGKESPILKNVWHARVAYMEKEGFYLLSGVKIERNRKEVAEAFTDTAVFYTSKDGILNWSEPIQLKHDGKIFGNHYVAVFSDDEKLDENVIGNRPLFYLNHNATDVVAYPFELVAE